MSAPSSFSGKNLITVVFAVLMILVLFALFSGSGGYDQEVDFSVSGSMNKGAFVRNEWFSAEICQIDRNVARQYGLSPRTKGVVITGLEGNQDVMMKLRNGDVITSINDKEVKSLRDFRKASQSVNPTQGMFLDIQRGGHPMYVAVSGGDGTAFDGNSNAYGGNLHPSPFTMTEVAPFMGQNFNAGGINPGAGVLGRPIEKWIASNFGRGYYACPKCGTIIPGKVSAKKGRMSCPNCNTRMVRQK